MPFLRNVVRGRNVPDARLTVVARQYEQVGGRSPINDHNRALLEALREALATRGCELPWYWGNRNWHPFITDTVADMAAAGHRRALVLATSAYRSYSGCRQYAEDLQQAQQAVGTRAPRLDKLPPFSTEPGFIEAQQARLNEILPQLGEDAALVFCAHSIPLSMASHCEYQAELQAVARALGDHAGGRPWSLVFQSRSGPPQQPWLEPDVLEHVEALAAQGVREVGALPIGFLCDHMEVIYDLDVLAAQRARDLGLRWVRGGTVGTHPTFVGMLADLIMRALSAEAPPTIVACAADCCRNAT